MTSALILSWVAIALLALVVSGLVRQVHQLSRGTPAAVRAPAQLGLRAGAVAPEAEELFGADLAAGGVLLFLSPGCRTCRGVLDEARRSSGHEATGPALRAVYADAAPPHAVAPEQPVPVLAGREDLFTAYDALATPFAVAVDAGGRVLRSVPLGAPRDLPALLDDAFPRTARSTR